MKRALVLLLLSALPAAVLAAEPQLAPAATAPPARSTLRPSATPSRQFPESTPAAAEDKAMEKYNEAIRKGNALDAAGNHFDAVLMYERAGRIAYNNKLKTDSAALGELLAKARKARDEGEEGEEMRFLELTARQATSGRTMKASDVCKRTGICVDGLTEEDRWLIANPYLPGDRRSFSMIYGAACSTDGTLYVAANGVVSAEGTRRRPRSNGDWYADNGHGLWRVAPDGRVTAFSVGPYGFYPPPGMWPKSKAVCDASVLEVSPAPDQWGGIAVAPNGDAYVSDREHHMILKLRGDGTVEHVAGGGEKACAYEKWKDKRESGYRDGPGKQALFNHPQGLAFDRDGNLFVADGGNSALRRIDPSGNVTTVQKGAFANPGDKRNNRKRINHVHVAIERPGALCVTGDGTVFVAPAAPRSGPIRKVDSKTREVSTWVY